MDRCFHERRQLKAAAALALGEWLAMVGAAADGAGVSAMLSAQRAPAPRYRAAVALGGGGASSAAVHSFTCLCELSSRGSTAVKPTIKCARLASHSLAAAIHNARHSAHHHPQMMRLAIVALVVATAHAAPAQGGKDFLSAKARRRAWSRSRAACRTGAHRGAGRRRRRSSRRARATTAARSWTAPSSTGHASAASRRRSRRPGD